ncbi:MAG TPA: M6 family metalloprotease domain-containing protein, partial [Candidatus Acidoferrum sp.]|nr:M6 family metalloprotease domain-containing protein [Candidatus Acidoferrum sp.]
MNQKIHSSARVETSFRRVKTLVPTLIAGVLLFCTARTYGINASPHPVDLAQPDGTRITLRPKGDEVAHWFEDMNGFTVVRDGARYMYAQRRVDGGLGPTAFMVGRDNPRALNLQEKLRPSPQFLIGERQKSQPQGITGGPVARILPVGTVKNLVILVRFSDHALGVHTREPADYNVIFNTAGGSPALAPTGSLKDYYRETSYGTMTLESTVIAWITLPQTEEYYAAGVDGRGFYPRNGQGMVKDALDIADSLVNFAQFDVDNDGFVDAIDIIHSGYAAETGEGGGNWIWSHKWSLFAVPGGRWTSGDQNGNGVSVKVFDYHTEPALWGVSGTDITRIGVIAHETGHFFGLPDLYDTDGGSEGIGSYCLMANSWGFDGSQLYPPHLSAWAKIELGWVTPITIAPGTYNAPRVETTRTIFRITNGYPNGEYLLIENRQPVGFEAAMPQGGLAIWHIDNNQVDNNDEGYPAGLGWPSNHYQVALLQADGAYHLERGLNRGDAGDVYRGGGVSSLTGITVPNTDGYQSGFFTATANQILNIGSSASNMTFTFANPN